MIIKMIELICPEKCKIKTMLSKQQTKRGGKGVKVTLDH